MKISSKVNNYFFINKKGNLTKCNFLSTIKMLPIFKYLMTFGAMRNGSFCIKSVVPYDTFLIKCAVFQI